MLTNIVKLPVWAIGAIVGGTATATGVGAYALHRRSVKSLEEDLEKVKKATQKESLVALFKEISEDLSPALGNVVEMMTEKPSEKKAVASKEKEAVAS